MPHRSQPSSAPHIIKVKPPSARLELAAAKKVYEDRDIDISTPGGAHSPCRAIAFNGRRSSSSRAARQGLDGVFAEVRAVRDAAATARSLAATPSSARREAIDMLGKIVTIYQGKD